MTLERLKELWIRYLDDGKLPPEEERELSDALLADEQLQKDLLNDEEMNGFLHGLGTSSEQEAGFTKCFFERLMAEGDANRFIRQVESRIEDGDPSVGLSKSETLNPREVKPPIARRSPPSTRRSRPSGTRSVDNRWIPFLIAAGLLFAVMVITTLLSSRPETNLTRKSQLQKPEVPDAKGRQEAERNEAQARRLEAEDRLREIERKETELAQPPPAPQQPNRDDEEKRRKEIEELKHEKERIERELRESTLVVQRPTPLPAPEPEKPRPIVEPKPEIKTKTVLAQVEEAVGDVFLVTKDAKTAVNAGDSLLEGQAIQTAGGSSRAVLRFADKTRVELGADTAIDEIKTDAGKRLFVSGGRVFAEVAKQPKDQPMIFATPYGEAKVLGTTLRVLVDPRGKGSTRLEVEEGKVQLKNLAGKTVEVITGHYAVAAAGTEPVARALPINDLLLLGSQGMKVGDEWRLVKDPQAASGSAWDALTAIPRSSAVELKQEHTSAEARARNRTGSYVEFRFTADADRDYVIWTRGTCLAVGNPIYDQPLYAYDQVLLLFPTGQISRPLSTNPNAALMNGHAVRKGYWWLSGDAWRDATVTPPSNPQDTVPVSVRFSKAGTHVVRLYAACTVQRIDAIWLSATQKTRPDDKSTGPGQATK